MAGNSQYNSNYTGVQVDDSVGVATVCLTAAELQDTSSTAKWKAYDAAKIIVVDKTGATVQYPADSLWHVVSQQVVPLAAGNSILSVLYSTYGTDGPNTSYIPLSSIKPDAAAANQHDLVISASSDAYIITSVNMNEQRAYINFQYNMRGQAVYVSEGIVDSSTGGVDKSKVKFPTDQWQAKKGDLIIGSNGGVFLTDGTTYTKNQKTYLGGDFQYSIKGARGERGNPGAAGADGRDGQDGNRWYSGTQLVINNSGGSMQIRWENDEWPADQLCIGDLYLVTEAYEEPGTGSVFTQGEVYKIKELKSTYAIMENVTNIKGEPGVAGKDGFNGSQLLHSSASGTSASTTSIPYNTLSAYVHPPAVGDMILTDSGNLFVITEQVASPVSELTTLAGTEWRFAETLDIESLLDGVNYYGFSLDFISGAGTLAHYMKFSKRDGIYVLEYNNDGAHPQPGDVKYGNFATDASISGGEGGNATSVVGDMNNDGVVNSDDAVYLLRHTLFPDYYPIDKFADFDGDGKVTADDAVYLLRHTLFPDQYPIDGDKPGTESSNWVDYKERTIFISGGTSSASQVLLPWMRKSRNATLIGTSATVRFCMNIGAGGGLPPVTPADAGKFLVVDSSGNWVAMTMQEWQGGNY